MAPKVRAVVLGTGAGGLSAAAFLARAGAEVVAVEKAPHVGGLLAPFERGGFRFEPGLHYVGGCAPGGMLNELLAELELDTTKLFCELDPSGFDVYHFPDRDVRVCSGLDQYQQRLYEMFPSSRDGIMEVLVLAKALNGLSSLSTIASHRRPQLSELSSLLELPGLLRWSRSSYGELLEHFIEDIEARAALAGACGDYGLPPARASALAALTVLAHFGDGAFFPRGGSGALRDAVLQRAKEAGAVFALSTAAQKIVLEDRKVRGVELENGEFLEADFVLSDIDAHTTFEQLVGIEHLPRSIQRKLQQAKPTLAPFVMYLGIRGDLRQRGLGASNHWWMPSYDLDATWEPYFRDEIPPFLPIFFASNSLKDDSNTLAPEGCHTLEISTFAPWSMFAPWEDVAPEARDQKFHSVKTAFEDRVFTQLEAQFPGLARGVVTQETATPLAFRHWIGAFEGGAYGPAQTPDFWGPFRFKTETPVRGLYLCGASVFGSGVAPCLLSGKLAAQRALATFSQEQAPIAPLP